jgi:hypothetical protein
MASYPHWSCVRLRCSWDIERHNRSSGTILLSPHLDLDSLRKRLYVCEKLQNADDIHDAGVPYRLGAIVPGSRWRTAGELDAPIAHVLPTFPGGFVALTVFANSAVQCLRSLLRSLECQSAHGAEHLLQLVEHELKPSFSWSGSPVINGVARNAAGLQTVTVDKRDNRRIGLHLDSWEACNFWERRFARNRISINVGNSVRRLLFMATPIEVVFRKLGLRPRPDIYLVDQAINSTIDRIRPVYSLEVRPGEAYIAPTECIVHDASTIGSSDEDCSITIRMMLLPAARGSF